MTSKRFLAAAGGVVLALALGTGWSAAQTGSTSPTSPTTTTTTTTTTVDHDAMHAQMRTQMPESTRAQCDAMHGQMDATRLGTMPHDRMGSSGMTGSGPVAGPTSGS